MNIEKIFSNKLVQSFLVFSIFRAIYGLAIVLIAYFFTQKYNLNIYRSLPIFIFSIMIIIIWSIPTFDYVWILTQGGPAYSSEVLATNLYSQAFDRFNVGYSSAIGTLMFIYTIFIVSIFGVLRKLGWEI